MVSQASDEVHSTAAPDCLVPWINQIIKLKYSDASQIEREQIIYKNIRRDCDVKYRCIYNTKIWEYNEEQFKY